MAFDFDAIKNAGAPYQRRRQAFEQEHARNTAAAQASTPAPPRSAAPFVISTLKTCVCGARPRYGFDEHQKHCKAAQLMRSADPPPVTAEEVVAAIEATEVPAGAQGGDSAAVAEVAPDWEHKVFGCTTLAVNGADSPLIKIGAKGDCPKCGRHFAKGLHLHHRACKG